MCLTIIQVCLTNTTMPVMKLNIFNVCFSCLGVQRLIRPWFQYSLLSRKSPHLFTAKYLAIGLKLQLLMMPKCMELVNTKL